MPLEISEIGVRLAVGVPGASGSPPESLDEDGQPGLSAEEEERIVGAAVAEVLRVLRMREER
jgi:hypothetical protein